MHASNGFLFKLEGPTRGETFVTRKITRAAAAIQHKLQHRIYIANLDAKRGLGHARDYVQGMWQIVQQQTSDDSVLATSESHSVREFIELAFAHVGRQITWRGNGVDEKGIDAKTGDILVEVDARYFGPTEVYLLLGDPSNAQSVPGWKHTTSFQQLVADMMDSDLKVVPAEIQSRGSELP
jgi:GDPmannose 4,6-dehydratase